MLLGPDGDAPLYNEWSVTAAPLSAKLSLEMARVSHWKSYGRTRIVVPIDEADRNGFNDALAFRRICGNDKEPNQDVIA